MQSRAGFPTVPDALLRGYESDTIDTGHIPPPVTSKETKGGNRGKEANTDRGVTLGAPLITGVTPCEYAPNADRPEVMGFRTYGGN